MRIAVYPGSFDPITLGHIDIINRSLNIFDKLIILVMLNFRKKYLFNLEERKNLIVKSINFMGICNCEVDSYDGLLVDYLDKRNIKYIVKGIRAVSDFEYEFQQYIVNSNFSKDIETIFFMTSYEHFYLSSSLVRELAFFGADISNFVPKCIVNDVLNKVRKLNKY